MGKTYLLVLPRYRPPLANQWRHRHWAVANRLRKEAVEIISTYARQQQVPRASCRRRVAVEVVLGPRMRPSDLDSFDKLWLDALKGAQMIVDDGPRWLDGRIEVCFRKGEDGDWGTLVYLSDVEED